MTCGRCSPAWPRAGRADAERGAAPSASPSGAGLRPDVQGAEVGVGALRRVRRPPGPGSGDRGRRGGDAGGDRLAGARGDPGAARLPQPGVAGRPRRRARRRAAPAGDVGGGGGGVPASHLPGRRPAAALARAGRQPRRGDRRAVERPVRGRPVPPRPRRRRGVPGRVPRRAHRVAGGGVAARSPRPRDRRHPPVAARRVLEALAGDRGVAGRHRHARHPGGPPGGGAGHPAAQARGRARTVRRGLEGRSRSGRVGTGCRRAPRRLVPAARRHRRPTGGGGSTPSSSTSTADPSTSSGSSIRRSGSPTCCAPS